MAVQAQKSASERIEALEQQISQIGEATAARGLKSGIPVHGFADVGYVYSRQSNRFETGPRGFGVGSFDLYLTPELGERVKSLVELVFEVDSAGELLVDLERVQIGYTFSDALTAWTGRFHTPYGYWNTGYHHGLQLQTSLTRPRFLEFEDKGGILPSHMVGVWLSGSVAMSASRVHYDFYFGNGPRIVVDAGAPSPGGTLNPNVGGDDNDSALAGARVELAPRGALSGWKLGLHGLRARVDDDGPAANRTRVATYGPYAVFAGDNWELLGEYYRFENRDLSGGSGTHRSSAWYAQAGYVLGRFTPYARAERASLDQTDNYFATLLSGHSYSRAALGVRFELSATSVLKLEAARAEFTGVQVSGGDDRFNELRAQAAMRF